MKRLLVIIALFIFSQKSIAQNLQKYGVNITTWDSIKVSGKLDAINDSTIAIRSSKVADKGKVIQLPASKIMNIKIWKKGAGIPFAIIGAAALGITAGAVTENGNGQTAAILTGSALGAVIGASTGKLFFNKINKRKVHLTDFKELVRKFN